MKELNGDKERLAQIYLAGEGKSMRWQPADARSSAT
jgi:hypothetical protein